MKPKLWVVEKGASERFDEISIKGRDSINRINLLKYIRSTLEVLSLRNIESLKEIVLLTQKDILEIVENKPYFGDDVKM